MKLAKISTLAFAAALLVPALASAQEVLHFEGVKSTAGDQVGGASTGAYVASRTPYTVASRFDIYCLDYDNTAKSVWTAHSVTFAEAVGINSVQAQRQLGTEKNLGHSAAPRRCVSDDAVRTQPGRRWPEQRHVGHDSRRDLVDVLEQFQRQSDVDVEHGFRGRHGARQRNAVGQLRADARPADVLGELLTLHGLESGVHHA